ncbi:hypothetical protein BDR06DRAFT_1010636 [Suillus hirtellus]|nr:hypothetical protein BDR06DRAFT_1010636 [Suillus hirtellus]
MDTIGFRALPATLHPTLTMHVHDFRWYGFDGDIITVSESQFDINVLEVVLNGPSTADMTFMSCGGLTTFYPELTLKYMGVRSQNGQKIQPGQSFGSVGKGAIDIRQHTSFLNKPCHSSCPILWRRVGDRCDYLMVEWDTRYEFNSFLHDNDTEWRLDVDCLNEQCNFCLQTTFSNEDVPPLFMPKDQADIVHLDHAIREHYPPYSLIFQGLLYATACDWPYLVPVPVQHGVTTSCTMQELEVNYWVHQRAFSASTASRSALRRQYDALLNFAVPLDDVYTFFFEDETNSPPPNSLVNNIALIGAIGTRFDVSQDEDITTAILERLSLPDLTKMGQTCHRLRDIATDVARRRFGHIIIPFTRHNYDAFLSVLRWTRTVITGSCACKMLTGEVDAHARDLNLVAPATGFNDLHDFITGVLRLPCVSKQCHPGMREIVGRFRKYALPTRVITVSTAKVDMHIMHIILHAPSTADMILMTAGGLVSLYSNMTLQGITLTSQTGHHVRWGEKLGTIGDIVEGFEVARSTEFLGGSCGRHCVTFWHQVSDNAFLLALDWNIKDSAWWCVEDVDVEWRVDSNCMNPSCPYRIEQMCVNYEGTNCDYDLAVKCTSDELACRRPCYFQLCDGLFYGGGCQQPYVVQVPVQDGIETLPSLDELEVNTWVQQRDLDRSTFSRRRLQHTFVSVLHSVMELDAQYTFYFEDPEYGRPQNELLQSFKIVLIVMMHSEDSALSGALVEAVLAASTAPNSASTGRLGALAPENNPRFWDPKIRSEQWYDTQGDPFTIQFPALIEPTGKHSRLDPYFSLPTLKQPELKDVRTVKAQFQLRTLDNGYPTEAIVCSKKAANMLMLLVSKCEAARGKDNREIIQFLQSAGNSSTDPLHFVMHTEPLLPEAAEAKRETIPKFSLEDFENTDLTFSGDILKQKFSAKKGDSEVSTTEKTRGVHDWKLKDMPNPHGHYHTVMDIFQLENVPVVVPNVRDAEGALIHPAEYSKIFTTAMPVVAEVVIWTFAPDGRREKGSRIYQTTLKSLKLLPIGGGPLTSSAQGSGNGLTGKAK